MGDHQQDDTQPLSGGKEGMAGETAGGRMGTLPRGSLVQRLLPKFRAKFAGFKTPLKVVQAQPGQALLADDLPATAL